MFAFLALATVVLIVLQNKLRITSLSRRGTYTWNLRATLDRSWNACTWGGMKLINAPIRAARRGGRTA